MLPATDADDRARRSRQAGMLLPVDSLARSWACRTSVVVRDASVWIVILLVSLLLLGDRMLGTYTNELP